MLDCSRESDNSIFYFENTMEGSRSSYIYAVFIIEKKGVWKTMEKYTLNGGRSMKFDMQMFYNRVVHFISDC